MNADRIFRNFLNVSQTTEDKELDLPLSAEETTQVIGYLNFHYGTEEHVVRAMFGTPGLIPEDFRNKYDPDVSKSTQEVTDFLGDLHKEDVEDFFEAVNSTEPSPVTELEFLEALSESKPAEQRGPQVVRMNKKFKGR